VLPDGDGLPWDVVRLRRSAWVVLADAQGRVLLVRRYRPGLNRWGWELPGDRVEPGEDPAETVSQEPAESVPALIAAGEIWSAATLIGLLQHLARGGSGHDFDQRGLSEATNVVLTQAVHQDRPRDPICEYVQLIIK